MALAQAIIEFVHNRVGAKTLFSTHYHELTALEGELDHLQNVHVGATEENGELVFLHKVTPGPADKSYGIHVAKLAGMPTPLLTRANQILTSLEGQETAAVPSRGVEPPAPVIEPTPAKEQTPVKEQTTPLVEESSGQLELFATAPVEKRTVRPINLPGKLRTWT